MVFDRRGRVVSIAQKEHEQIYPHPGWVEHDALEIWRRTLEVIDEASEARGAAAEGLRCHRDHEPAGDNRRLEQRDGAADL